jgi:LysR family nod box-dependent transcriptional activator
MRLNRLDLNLLVALDALLAERSITRAAERIHLSQPATSGALARLREYFGDELLVRVGAQMKPTPLGESLAGPVSNILMQIQSTVERGVEFDPQTSDRKFRVMCSDYVVSTVFTPLVSKLSKLAPKVKIEIFSPFSNPSESLEQGEVDFLLMPNYVLADDHPTVSLFEEGFVCLGWENNRIFDTPLTQEEYLSAGHVAVLFGSTRQPSRDKALLKERFGVELNIEITTSTFNALPPLVVDSKRIATCYRRLAQTWAALLPIKISPLPFELPEVAWSLQWHKYRDLDPGVLWFRDQVKKLMTEI